MNTWITRHERLVPLLAAVGLVAGLMTAGALLASDHQDTPEVELSPRFDVNDVYAFPSATAGRIALVLGTSSPLTPAMTPSAMFGTKDQELYQIKIDNTGDAVEDLVLQAAFESDGHGGQRVMLYGPYKPTSTGAMGNALAGEPTLTGKVNHVIGSPAGIQLFAGPRDDPFFIDLEQFFRVLPDRRPSTGPLSVMPTPASTFRDAAHAVDFVRGFNDLAIVVELPVAMLATHGDTPGKFGVWGTTSRARSATH
ncbi:MAG: hypothetical protein JWL95_2178 [Gemmatimonadetes bacterium]|nr:hypothetical protein [Gemmatimonadota bacterium]